MAISKGTVSGVGTKGISRDAKPSELPPEYFTDGRNIRFVGNRAELMGGVLEVNLPGISVFSLGIVPGAVDSYILFTDRFEIYAFDAFDTFPVGRVSGYTETPDNFFHFEIYNGLALGNNFTDIPQVWDINRDNKFQNLPLWDTTWRTRYLRPSGAFLFALNMTEAGVRYEHKIRWSAAAEPGAVPNSWDEADPTTEAGTYSFPDTMNGRITGGLELDRRFLVYKEGAIWQLSYVGGTQIFSRDNLTMNVGLSIPRSLVHVPNGPQGRQYHFFAGQDGFYLTDGNTVDQVFDKVFREEYLALADLNISHKRAFSVVNYRASEIWFCFPESGATYATLAFIFNYKDQTYAIRELNQTFNMVSGASLVGAASQQSEDVPYFEDAALFNDGAGYYHVNVFAGSSTLIESCPLEGKAYYSDFGSLDYDEGVYAGWVERQTLPLVKYDTRDPQAKIVEYGRLKQVEEVIPKVFLGQVRLEIGVQDLENEAISWIYNEVLDDTQYKHDLTTPVIGRFISFRFSSLAGEEFKLSGFDYMVSLWGTH